MPRQVEGGPQVRAEPMSVLQQAQEQHDLSQHVLKAILYIQVVDNKVDKVILFMFPLNYEFQELGIKV